MSVISRQLVKDKEAELKRQAAELNKLKHELRLEDLDESVALYESIEAIQKAYDKRDYSSLKNLCSRVVNMTADGAPIIERDPLDEIKEYENIPPAVNFPEFWSIPGEYQVPKGVMTMLGAEPGVGKTSVAVNLAFHFIAKNSRKILFLSAEMTPRQIWVKFYQVYAMIHEKRPVPFRQIESWLRFPGDNPAEVKKIHAFVDLFKKYLKVVDCSGFTPSRVLYEIDKSVEFYGSYPDFAIVDYIQILSTDKHLKNYDKRLELIESSRHFKEKAKAENLGLIVLSQLNDRGDYMESKAMHQDAGMSIILERPLIQGEYSQELTIRFKKNRFGPIGESQVYFDGRSGTVLGGTKYNTYLYGQEART